MPLDDATRLRHMLDAAEEAVTFATGKTRVDFDRERMLTLALVRLIEIIGEAAANVTPATKAAHAEIPWRQIVGTRNRLVHAYFAINLDILWETISNDLPTLIVQLRPIVRP